MIVVATSGVNACTYCVVAHGAILRIRAKNPLIADQVAVNHRKADLVPRHKAMLDFAIKVTERSHAIDDADYEGLKSHGFSDDDAWYIAAIAAMFAMSNRLANAFSIRANDEFYAMGRESLVELSPACSHSGRAKSQREAMSISVLQQAKIQAQVLVPSQSPAGGIGRGAS